MLLLGMGGGRYFRGRGSLLLGGSLLSGWSLLSGFTSSHKKMTLISGGCYFWGSSLSELYGIARITLCFTLCVLTILILHTWSCFSEMAQVSKARNNPHSHSQCPFKTKRLALNLRICFKEKPSKTKKEIKKKEEVQERVRKLTFCFFCLFSLLHLLAVLE